MRPRQLPGPKLYCPPNAGHGGGVPIWLMGMTLLSFRHIGGWMLAHRIARTADEVANSDVLHRFASLLRQMRVRSDVIVRQSFQILTPMVVGVFRTTIVLPASVMTSLSPEQWEAILAHELAHVRRHDFVWNLVSDCDRKPSCSFTPRFGGWDAKCDSSVSFAAMTCLLRAQSGRLPWPKVWRFSWGSWKARHPPIGPWPQQGKTDRIALQRVRRLLAKQRSEPRSIVPAATWVAGLGLVLLLGLMGPLQSQDTTVADNDQVNSQETPEAPDNDESEPESWEISKKYDASWLRHRLLYQETVPDKIVVPAVRGVVLSPEGELLEGVSIHSHTPRQWLRLLGNGTIKTNRHDPFTRSRAGGKFGIPSRTETVTVAIFLHEQGVASVSHEELIYSQGRIQLQRWARIEGQFVMNGEPQSEQPIRLYVDTLPWSYTRGGPRLTTEYTTKTDNSGKFVFEKVPPLPGRVHAMGRPLHTRHNVRYTCRPGETTRVQLGAGRTIRGQLVIAPLRDGERIASWTDTDRIVVSHALPDPPYPKETTG